MNFDGRVLLLFSYKESFPWPESFIVGNNLAQRADFEGGDKEDLVVLGVVNNVLFEVTMIANNK